MTDDAAWFADLDNRFGPWGDERGVAVLKTALAGFDDRAIGDAQDAVRAHYHAESWQEQEGLLHLKQFADDPARQRSAESVMETFAAVVQWDLYHRVADREIVAFHGGKGGVENKLAQITRGEPVFAGYSWTPFLDKTEPYFDCVSGAPAVTATVLQVRDLFLNWCVPVTTGIEEQINQCEVAARRAIKLDQERSTVFPADHVAWPRLRAYFNSNCVVRRGGDWSVVRQLVGG